MADALALDVFLAPAAAGPIFDVRTPAEYAAGHVPGALSLPLFTDAERAEVGTVYKQQGRHAAMHLALGRVGPRLPALVEAAEAHLAAGDAARVYCWRGGLRSESVAWLLRFFGYRVARLQGGYKAYRRHVRAVLQQRRPVRLVGGMTGARKTEALHALARHGEPVIDLEALAGHRGSVFGHLGLPPQPSQEQFENILAARWQALEAAQPVWLEDESRRLGRLVLPEGIWASMQGAEVWLLEVPFETRVAHLVAHYGGYPPARLAEAIGVLRKRLGGLRTQQAQEAVARGDLETACRLLLTYYDGAYRHNLARRGTSLHRVPAPPGATPEALAEALQAGATTPPLLLPA